MISLIRVSSIGLGLDDGPARSAEWRRVVEVGTERFLRVSAAKTTYYRHPTGRNAIVPRRVLRRRMARKQHSREVVGKFVVRRVKEPAGCRRLNLKSEPRSQVEKRGPQAELSIFLEVFP